MKAIYTYTIAGLSTLVLLGSLAACDEAGSSTDAAATQDAEAVAQTAPQSTELLARYDEGKLTLAVSTDAARETLLESASGLIRNINEVTFESPELKMIGNAPVLMMRGKKPDGNCALAYVQLASEDVLAAGAAPSISEAQALGKRSAVLYPARTYACNGSPCSLCDVTGEGACVCRPAHGLCRPAHGPGGEEGWCNHSTGG